MAAKRPIRILCYGDSNTWGTYGHWKDVGKRALRFAPEDRWPCVMQQELGDGFEVIEEGLGGRTAFADHVDGPWKNGLHTLPTILHSHKPLDLVAIMLGTNDLAQKKDITEDDIYRGACMMVDAVRGENCRIGLHTDYKQKCAQCIYYKRDFKLVFYPKSFVQILKR